MDDVRPAGLQWSDFQLLPALATLADAPPHLRLYAFSADRQADPAHLDAARRDSAVALITATAAAIVVLAEERFAPEVAQAWAASLRQNGHPVARWLRAPLALVRAFYARDAQRRRIAAQALASATDGSRHLLQLLAAAMARGASDVDIVVDEETPSTTLRLRVHGSWIEHGREANVYGLDLMRAAFAAIRLDERMRGKAAWSPRADLAGVARFPQLRNLQLRLQQMAERSGVGLSLRLLSYDGLTARYRSLADLGYAASQAQALTRALGRSTGLVLVVGATGSGKTTTLNLAVATSPRFAERKWVSVEDPPEIDTPGIFQIPVATAGAFGASLPEADAFTAAMRKVLRFTPDGVIAGEIRDRDSAHLAVQMALTGHVVAASLHASDAFLALARLSGRDLGVDPAVLQEPGVLSVVVAQRLLPRLCSCSLTLAQWDAGAAGDELQDFERLPAAVRADPGALRFRNAAGCERCRAGRAGYSGRVVCAQLVSFDDALLDAWRRCGLDAARSMWRERGGAAGPDADAGSIAQHAIARLRRGECDVRDVAAAFDTPTAPCQAPTSSDRDLQPRFARTTI